MTMLDTAARVENTPRLLAYLKDADSAELVRRAAPALMPGEVRTGGLADVTADLEKRRSPEILLIDLSGIADPAAAMEDLARVCEPSVRVIAVGETNDIALYRDLRRLGIAEYLAKPLTRDVLEHTLRNVGSGTNDEVNHRLGKLVTVVGARGGTGATTVAVHLGLWLANDARGRSVLVDLDLQGGTVALSLNLKPETALREAVESPERVDDLFMERSVLAASDRLAVLAAQEALEDPLEIAPAAALAVLTRLQTRHNYVVADLGRAQTAAGRAILAVSSIVVLVGESSLAGLRDLVRLKAFIAATASGARTVVVLNRHGEPGQLKKADVIRALGGLPEHTIPYRPVPLALAAGLGEPAFRHCRAFADAISRLGVDVAGRPALKRGFFRRWRGR